MPWTQTDIDTLKAAIAAGIKEVEYDGPPRRKVVYQDTAAMLTALGAMQAEVNAAAGETTYKLLGSRKGFDS